MIKILHLGSPTGLYGAERWILALVKHLDSSKVESIVAAIKDSPEVEAPLCLEAAKLGIQTKIFESYGKLSWSAVSQLRAYILEEKIDILHTHFYKTDLIGYLATRGTSCRIITTPHGWSKNVDFKLRTYERLDRMLFPFMDAVVPLSQELYDGIGPVHRFIYSVRSNIARLIRPASSNSRINESTNIHLINNGVDISEIDAVTEVAPELQEWKVGGAFVLGYIGRLTPGKGLDTLIRAMTDLNGLNARLGIVGEGEQRAELEEQVTAFGLSEKVQFFGFQAARLTFLKGFDAFVLPSRSEGIPRCLMEAMAAKVSIIASDIPGCRVLIKDWETGVLFKCDDAQMLADRIKALAGGPEQLVFLSNNARSYVNGHHSAERLAKEYEKLYSANIDYEKKSILHN